MSFSDLLIGAGVLYVLRIAYGCGRRRARREALEGHRRELVEERDHYRAEAMRNPTAIVAQRFAIAVNRLEGLDAQLRGDWRRGKSCDLRHLALRARLRTLEDERRVDWLLTARERGHRGAAERAMN